MDGLPTDWGKQEYPDGTLFEGSFETGVKNGNGILTFKDGSRYEGSFKNDKMEVDITLLRDWANSCGLLRS